MDELLSSLKELSIKYLVYFNDNSIASHQSDLLNDMATISETFDTNLQSPLEILKEIMGKFGYNKSYYQHIVDIKDHYSTLSIIELFTLLYFCTCRNTLIFDNDFYILSINNGSILSLLNEINKR